MSHIFHFFVVLIFLLLIPGHFIYVVASLNSDPVISQGLMFLLLFQFSSVIQSCPTNSLRPHGMQHARPPCPSATPRVYPNYVHWVSDAIQPSHPLSSHSPPTFNLSQDQGLFQGQFFASGGQSIGVSASESLLPMNTQDWSPLGCTGWISLQSKGLSRVFSSTTVQKHQFFGTQLSL